MNAPRRRVLVLQLLRLGDILQTTPMLRSLRNTEPETEITLVLQDHFQSVPIPAALYDRLVAFPWTSVRDGLAESPWGWPEQVERVRAFVASLGDAPYDLLLNFSHSPLASYMCSLIPYRQAGGLVMAPDRTQVNHSPWLTYFFASIGGRSKGCFNLVDLHTWSAGVPARASRPEIEVGADARARVAEWLDARRLGARPLIAVQLGASEAKRMYPPDTMAGVLNRIPSDEADVVFVGVAAERALAEATRTRLTRPAQSAVGETSIRELAALLERCRLLLTVDTGTMHVAAAVGTRIVALFAAGPVFVHRTGPYGDRHLVVEPTLPCFPCETTADCRHFACHHAIPPAEIAATVRFALGTVPRPCPTSARILEGRFAANGHLEFRPLWPAAPSADDLDRLASARVWEESLGVPGHPRQRDDGAGRARQSARRREATGSPGAERIETIERLADLAESAARAAGRIVAATPGEQERLAAAVRGILDRMRLASEVEPICQPFVVFLTVRLNGLVSGGVAATARGYAAEYRDTATRLRRLAELLSDPSWIDDGE